MSEWYVTGEKLVNDDKGFFVCEVDDASIARQIVREHNAYAEMVEIIKNSRDAVVAELYAFKVSSKNQPRSPYIKGHIESYQALLANIDAVLARAEGRTK